MRLVKSDTVNLSLTTPQNRGQSIRVLTSEASLSLDGGEVN